jgi:glycosyltransferase involved in cell wall biosynthesis
MLGSVSDGAALLFVRQGTEVDTEPHRCLDIPLGTGIASPLGLWSTIRRSDLRSTGLVDMGRGRPHLDRVAGKVCILSKISCGANIVRVMHIITRMIVGGAQENTLYNCIDLIQQYGDDVILVTGPSLGAEGKLLETVPTNKLEIRTLPHLRRAIHPWNDWMALREIQTAIKDWKPDVVHTHSAKGGLLGRAGAWRLCVPCVVHTVHGAPFHPFQNRLSRRFFVACERWAAKRCHHMISVAHAMTELMVNAGVAPASRFTTIYSGMDVEPFLNNSVHRSLIREQYGVRDDDILFGKIARLFHLKGHEYVVDAAFRVVKRIPNAKFLFVGDGILKSDIQNRIAGTELGTRIIFPGLVAPSEIPAYVSAMDVLVHASLREGLARALPQALLSRKPVVSFDIDGAKEVVIPDVTGCLVAPKDVGGLADAMIRLGESESLRQAMGNEGARRFTEQFRHETMTRLIRDVYLRVIADINSGRRN